MQYISCPQMKDFFLFFIGNFYHETRLSIKNQNKLWKYLHFSLFFSDFSRIMLYGTLSKMESSKATDMYKAIDIEINIGTHDTASDDPLEIDKKHAHYKSLTNDQNPILEEFNGFRTDIDGLKNKLRMDSHVLAAKKLTNELMVVRAFKNYQIKPENGNFVKEGFKKFIKKIETVRLTEYIQVPLPKELQLMRTTESPALSPSRVSSQKSKSILLTRLPKKSQTILKKIPSINNNKLDEDKKNAKSSITPLLVNLSPINKINVQSTILIEKNKLNVNSQVSRGYLMTEGNNENSQYWTDRKPIKKKLYPLSFKDLDETNLDHKVKSSAFSLENIKNTDRLFGLHAAEILSFIIKNAIENYDDPIMKKIIELNGKDYSLLMTSIFQPEKGVVFKEIFEVFLTVFQEFYFIFIKELLVENQNFFKEPCK